MKNSRYKDPWGNKTRALERNIIKYRSLEMVLVLHYAEEIKILVQRAMKCLDSFDKSFIKKYPKLLHKLRDKKSYFVALKIWEKEGLITNDEKKKIIRLTQYRNDIAHRIKELNADLSTEKFFSDFIRHVPDHFCSYQYNAAEELRTWIQELEDRFHKNYSIGFFDHSAGMFRTTENVLTSELQIMRKKVDRLYRYRRNEGVALNREIELIHNNYMVKNLSDWVFRTYDNGRLTPRRQEICYRLFDDGFSTLAIAHAFGLMLRSIKKRKNMWDKLGGKDRPKISLEDLPIRRSPPKYDD